MLFFFMLFLFKSVQLRFVYDQTGKISRSVCRGFIEKIEFIKHCFHSLWFFVAFLSKEQRRRNEEIYLAYWFEQDKILFFWLSFLRLLFQLCSHLGTNIATTKEHVSNEANLTEGNLKKKHFLPFNFPFPNGNFDVQIFISSCSFECPVHNRISSNLLQTKF